MIKLKKLLTESPDTIIPHGERITWNNDDALGFLLDKDGELLVTGWGALHTDLEDMESFYDGRLWTEPKIVSFWDYPVPREFVDIAKKLKDKTKIDILSDGWTIEIFIEGKNRAEFVPTVDYGEVANKIKNPSQQEYQKHLDRAKKDIPKGWGSKKIPAGLSATQAHQMQTTSDGTIKLKTLVESPDTIYDEKGDVKVEYMDRDAYPFYYDFQTNKLYMSDESGEDHWHVTHDMKQYPYLADVSQDYIRSRDPDNKFIAGRIWISNKMISFWQYPNTAKGMKQIINAISKHFDIEIWNSFNLEIYEETDDYINDIEEGPSTIIPLKTFKQSDNPPEEEYQQHLLSPVKKKKIGTPKGVGSKKTPAGLSATQRHQMQTASENKIEESPDWVDDDDGKRIGSWTDTDAYPFGYYKNKMYLSSIPGITHQDIPAVRKVYPKGVHRTQFKFSGRVWAEKGAISFWDYPKDNSEMKKVAVDLSKAIEHIFGEEIDIWNEYNMDIIVDKDNRDVVSTSEVEWDKNYSDAPTGYESKLIKVKDFSKSKKRPDDELAKQHVMSPTKKKNVSTTGIGSKKTPAGLSQTQRHQIKMTSDGMIKLKSLIESPDSLWIDEPGTEDDGEYLGYHNDDAYGFYFSNDILYISDEPGLTHGEGVMRSGKYDMNDIVRDIHNGGKIPYGRIWVDTKLLSFWSPPESRNEMHDIADELSNNFGDIDVWNDFGVEVYGGDIFDGGDSELIPVKSYKSSDAAPDEDFQRHLLSPDKKKNINIPTGIGSTKRPTGLSITQRHQMASTSEIKESPDRIESTKDGKDVMFNHGERSIPYTFGYYKNKLYIQASGTHISLPPKGIEREDYDYPGRLWTLSEIISFWIYPENKTKLYKIFKDITNSIGIPINPKEWYVDVLLDKDSKELVKRIMTAGGYTDYDVLDRSTAVLIPANEYEGSLDNDINVKHMIIPIMKSLYGMKVPKDWGSKRVPGGLSTTQRRQMISTSEGLNEWADRIHLKGKHTVLDYEDMDAYPFIFVMKENKVYIGEPGESHVGSVETDYYWKREGALAGRIWTNSKIISFWEYPDNVAMYKNLIVQLNKAIVIENKRDGDNIPKVTASWKLDLPDTSGDLFSNPDFHEKMSIVRNLDNTSDFRDIKSNLIPIFDWEPNAVKNPKFYVQQMQDKRKQHMLSPIAKKAIGAKGIGSRKTPTGLSSTQIHQMKSTSEIKEWADSILFDRDGKTIMLDFEDRDAIPFGYTNGKMKVGGLGDEHGKANIHNGVETSAGRLWYKKRVISFWYYPKTMSKLHKIIKDVNIALRNNDDLYPEAMEIDDYWKIDIPDFPQNADTFDMFKRQGGIDYEMKSTLVPIKDYNPSMIYKSKDFKDKLKKRQKMHMLSPIAKKAIGAKDIGSRKTPAGLSSTQRHQVKS